MLYVENVTVKFGGLVAVDNVTLEVREHEIVGLIGPNGAGKTTLFNSITNIHKPTSGRIVFDTGKEKKILSNFPTHAIIHSGIARTFQNVRLFQKLTVLENVLVGLHSKQKASFMGVVFQSNAQKQEEKENLDHALYLLDYFHLASLANVAANSLPFGNQKVLEIVRALAVNPKLLLLDEPAAGLNTKETHELMELLIKVKQDFKPTMFLIEHDMKFVMSLTERIYVLDYGELIAEGTPREIQKNKNVITAYLGEPVA